MIVAVVPALDEEERIAAVAQTMPSIVERIVVVDDGSRDGTASVARAADPRVEIVAHARPRGVGAAIAAGVLHARDGADAIVVLAGDGQMDPRDLDALLAPILAGRADFVKGDRLAWPNGARAFPRVRLAGVVLLAAATRLATGVATRDAQCGYVAFGRRALDSIDWTSLWPSFGYPNDVIACAARLGLRIAEVPVRPIYRGERSKLRATHLPGIGWVIARALARRIAGGARTSAKAC